MFTIAGILADEEPKTAISPNGLYNSSDLTGSGDFALSSTLIGGTSEATLMGWFYLSPSTPSNFQLYPYQEVLAGKFPLPIYFLEDKIKSSFPNSNGGNNVCEYLTTTPINQWIHVAVTWSVSNSRLRIYLNGTLQASSVISYANASTTSAFFENYSSSSDSVDIAQFNVYNRELTGTEVAEHYVVIDAQVGVLSYDAMTTAQRSGLIYSTSFIDDISYDGNEFKDKSTSNISLSPQPSLTGQQIYVYTDVATTQTYTANYADFDTDQTVYTDNVINLNTYMSNGFSFFIYAEAITTADCRLFNIQNQSGDPQAVDITINRQINGQCFFSAYNGSSYNTITSSLDYLNTLRPICVTYGGTSDPNFRLYVDSTSQGTVTGSNVNSGTLNCYATIGGVTGATGGTLQSGGRKGFFYLFNKQLNQTEVDDLSANPTYTYSALSEIGLDTNVDISIPCANWNNNNGSEFTDDTGNATVSLNTGVAGSIAIDGTGPDVISS